MKKNIITAGEEYTDIDTLACAIAYGELLELMGQKSRVVLAGAFNKSITDEIKNWDLEYETKPNELEDTDFVIVDISESAHVAKFVDQERIIKLFDHHFGFEDYWKERLRENAIIEKVGACATLIWEEFVKFDLQDKISEVSANLLYAAIVSNTLNFKAFVTSDRDRLAYEQLKKYISLPDNWENKYFMDQDRYSFQNPYEAVAGDVITVSTEELGENLTIGQLELWNGSEFIGKCMDNMISAMRSFGNDFWFFSSPSISEGINYIYAENDKIKVILGKLLKIKFNGNMAKTEKLVMRKEIKKLILEETI